MQEQRRFDAFPLYRKDSGSRTFLDRLGDAAAISRQGENFYELRLRSLFSELWESVYTWAASCQSEKPLYDPSDNDRIKKILQFMQQHYSEHLEVRRLPPISRSANGNVTDLFKKLSWDEPYGIFNNT